MENEINDALRYLEEFEKGRKQENVEEKEGEGEGLDVLKAYHEKQLAACVSKAKKHKEILDKIDKGEDIPDEAFEDEEEVKKALNISSFDDDDEFYKGEEPEELEGSEEVEEPVNKGGSIEEIVKAAVSSALKSQERSFEKSMRKMKNDFEEQIEKISNTPVRKSIIKGNEIGILQKAITGEKEDGKTLLSVTLQKGQVSDALFGAFESEKDSITKGKLGDAVAQYEASGYISPEIAGIMLEKGYRLIK